MRKSVVIGSIGTIIVSLGILAGWIWHSTSSSDELQMLISQGGAAFSTPEFRAAQKRAMEIIETAGQEQSVLTAQDWTDVKAMTANADGNIRARGLTLLQVFERTGYEQAAWELALKFLASTTVDDRLFASSEIARLRPTEAPQHIAPLLTDPDAKVRENAKDLMVRLGYSHT